jgi:apolipoprotein D and lipocalin family protein
MGNSSSSSLPTPNNVVLEKFMGDWYVIKMTPLVVDKGASNAIESYKLSPDGKTILVKYKYVNKKGKQSEANAKAWLRNPNNPAIWTISPFFPIRAQYKIGYVSDNYDVCIVARDKRDLVWIMARTPKPSNEIISNMVNKVKEMGYDISVLYDVPHT